MPVDHIEEEGLPKNPNLLVAQWKFLLGLPDQQTNDYIKKQLMESIETDNMAPFYEECCTSLHWEVDAGLLAGMKKNNVAKLKELDGIIQDAESNLGETEVQEAHWRKAEYLCSIGAKEEALKCFQITYDKTVSLGQRLDIVFHLIRIGFFYLDHDLITQNINKAKSLIEEGGDWDRRNRLKVYRGVYCMMIRDFKCTAHYFLDASLTFTSYELMDYPKFVRYIVIISIISVPRNELREKIVKSAEIQEVLHYDFEMKDYLLSLFNCHYADFFKNLANVENILKHDYYLFPHYRHYVREMRLIAYKQLLQCHSTLTLTYMADAFGVTSDYVDKDLSRFIADGRLTCTIDKVAGVVETNHPDAKNWQYQEIMKQGDILLNRVQKLSRVINI